MKKIALLICCILNSCLLLAQTAATPASKTPDSTSLENKKNPPASALKEIDGTAMIPAYTISANIARSKNLSQFLNVVNKAGLYETFRSKGPITIFVPDNGAFANLSQGKLDTLLQTEHKYELIALVTYHAVPGKITAKNIASEISAGKGIAVFTTLSGSILTAKIDENKNIVLIDENGGRCIFKRTNLKQLNGLIHTVSAVLIPKFKAI